jgi:endonuclease/exonuclease/phosphatase family metal-dependent hydrolase
MKKIYLIVIILLIPFMAGSGQNRVRIMSYNLHNYPNKQDSSFRKIISAINPDLLVVLEMSSQAGVNQFLAYSLSQEYMAAPDSIRNTNSAGYNGNDCAFYYKNSVFTLIGKKEVPARTRVLSEFILMHILSGDTLVIFGIHLKANDYSTDNILNARKREDAVNSLREETKTFAPSSNYLACGDFNIFSSSEDAFRKLTDRSAPGFFIDMLNASGSWSGDSTFASICTYSSTTLDTRLDMIMISPALESGGGVDYIPGSFKIFGNDGLHYGTSVDNTVLPNYWFASDTTLGSALIEASDHLPVYADFYFGVATGAKRRSELPDGYCLLQNYPNPFNGSTTIIYSIPTETRHASSLQHVTLKFYDLLGREVATLVNDYKLPGKYKVTFNIEMKHPSAGGQVSPSLPSGVYFYTLSAGGYSETRKMVFLK